jgi:hypothetical protein
LEVSEPPIHKAEFVQNTDDCLVVTPASHVLQESLEPRKGLLELSSSRQPFRVWVVAEEQRFTLKVLKVSRTNGIDLSRVVRQALMSPAEELSLGEGKRADLNRVFGI